MMRRSSMNKNITAIKKLAHLGKYQEAAKIADEIRWGRVKDVKTLNMVSDIYEKCERYHDAKRVMMVVYNRVDANKRLVYKMCELSAKAGDLTDAEEFYWEFSNLAPKDSGKLILAYYIMCASKEPDEKKIEVLELYIKEDFDEKWAYKLAQLYYKTGQTEKCVRACDEIILWYSGDRYGAAALRLKHKCIGIEDEVVQPAKSEVADEDNADNIIDEVNDGVEEEWISDSKEDISSNEEPEEVNLDSKPEEESLATKNEDEPTLWFDLKDYNKCIIIREDEGEGAAEFGGRVRGEEFDTDVDDTERPMEAETCDEAENEIAEDTSDANAYCEEAVVEEYGEETAVEDECCEDAAAEDELCEDASEEEICQPVLVEGASSDVADTERRKRRIVLEKSTEREKVFVFNQNVIGGEEESFEDVVELVEEAPLDEAVRAIETIEEPTEGVIEAVAEISEDEDIILFADNEIFIEADIADVDEEESFEDESFAEEIFVDEDIADEDSADEVAVEGILEEDAEVLGEHIKQFEEGIVSAGEVFTGTVESNTDEEVCSDEAESAEIPIDEAGNNEGIAEELTETTVEEEIGDDPGLIPEESKADFGEEIEETGATVITEGSFAEEPEDTEEAEAVSLAEAAATAEVQEDSIDQKVSFVGYIDRENNFKPVEDETEAAEKELSEKMVEYQAAEKTNQQKKLRYDHNNVLRVLLVECSQMKGGVKYAASKLRSIHQQEGTKLYGIARISDTKLSIRGVESAISVLKGRDLVVESVDGITYEVVNELMELLDEDMKPTILAIVDTPTKLALFINRHRTFADRCEYIYEEASISRREFLNYINNYAYKLDAVLDDMAEEELEYIADEMIEDGIAFTISEAATLVERALEKAQKPGLKGLFEAKKDSDGYLILRARHFDRG